MSAVKKDVILDVLNFIGQMKIEDSSTSYIAIKNALKLFSIPIPVVTIPSGTKLFRIRIHDMPNKLYTRIQDLGHRVDRNGITQFGRANEPLQSIFYCSDNRQVAFCESSRLVRQKNGANIEENTVGVWRLKRDIQVATLPRDSNDSNNPTVKYLNGKFDQFVKENFCEDLSNYKLFINWISKEYYKENQQGNNSYLITAAFSNYIFETAMMNPSTEEKVFADGITYPSVQWTAKGMNFALRPELVESRDIELTTAVYNKMQLAWDHTYVEVENIISKSISYDSFEISW